MNKRALALVAVSLTGCITDLQVPNDTEIACKTASDCPDGTKCVVEVGRCAPASSSDTTAPSLQNVVLTPAAGGGGTTFTLTFSVDEALLVHPVVTGESGGLSVDWTQVDTADGYAFSYAASAATPDGVMTVKARLIDAAGNAVTATAGTVTVDTAGPVINLLLVSVASNVPGVADTVSGAVHATEAGVHIDCFADAGLTSLVGTVTAASDGSFGALPLGDNYTRGTLHGQSAFWLRGTDSFGNVGDSVPVLTDVAPPVIQLVAIERLTAADSWVAATAFRDTNGDPSGRVRVLVAGQLAALPQLSIGTAGPNPVFAAGCGLESLGPAGGVYVCLFGADGTEPEATPLDVVVDVVSFGAGNVGTLSAGSVSLDFTPPVKPNAASISVTMNPKGTADTLTLGSGSVEPNARVEVYGVLTFQNIFGFQCENQVIASAQADASGAAVLDLGDNQVESARLHQVDAAGNPGCGPCSINAPCTNFVPVLNDTDPPSISINTSVSAISSSVDAAFYVSAIENGPSGDAGPIVHPPVETYCALDGAAEVPCGTAFTASALGAGLHKVTYRARDALLNATAVETFTWEIHPTTPVFSGKAYASLGDKSYVVDNGGMGHLFLGGDALYHVYESAPGTFAVETLNNEPAAAAVATFNPSNGQFSVLFQRGGTEAFDVALARGTTGAWSTLTVHSGRVPVGSVDLIRDSGGALRAAYSRCTAIPDTGCFVNGPNLNAFAVDVATVASGAPTIETVPGTAHSLEPRIAASASGDLWLFYRDYPGSGTATLLLAQRTGGAWQAPLIVGGAGAPGGAPVLDPGDFRFFPTIAMTSLGTPAVTYKPTLNGPTWSAAYDGSWTFFNTLHSSQAASLSSGTANLWYLTQGPVDILRRSSAPVWSTSSLGVTDSPWGIAGALLTDGTFGSTAQLHAVMAFVDQTTRLQRIVVNGGTNTTAQMGELDGYRSFAPLAGAATPSVVVAAGTTMTVRQYGGDAWGTTATIRSNLTTQGYGLDALTSGGTTWVAHLDHENSSTEALYVEHGSGVSWTTSASLLSGVDLMAPQIAALPSGDPVIIVVQRTAPAAILATWWNGSAFVPFTTLVSLSNAFQVPSYAVLGDHNGGTAGGETWVAYGDTVNLQIRVVRFTATGENTSAAGCETCVVENATFASQPWVTIGLSPAGDPQVLTSDVTDGLRLVTKSSGTWQTPRDLGSELNIQVLDPNTGAWTASAYNCFPPYGGTRSPFDFAYGAGGRLHVQGRLACGNLGNDDVEIMAIEGASAFPAYPVAVPGQVPDVVHGVWVQAGGATLGAWGAPSNGDVLSFDSSHL